MSLTLGIVQYENSYRWDKTFLFAKKTIKEFKSKGADIVCFQEAFLSGYGAESLMLDYQYIDEYIEKIRTIAYKEKICVFIPTLIQEGLDIFNATYVFNHDDGDSLIFKEGLTPSEKIMMNPKKGDRRFTLKGFDLGVLVCREVEDKVYTYFEKKNLPDLILWPSYWGWEYKNSWGKKRLDGKMNLAYKIVSLFKRPMIQINMASTSLATGKILKTGKSVIVNPSGKRVGLGAYGSIDKYLVQFDGKFVRKLK